MSNRAQRRAIAAKNTFYRVTPMQAEESVQGVDLQDSIGNVSYIDTKFNECLVALVPPTCSYEMAREIEQRLIKALKRNVLVMTDNVMLCRVEGPLDKKEIVEVFKGVENADPEAVADALIHRAIVADEEKEAQEKEAGEAHRDHGAAGGEGAEGVPEDPGA